MLTIILSGGPCTGKSTTFEMLRGEYPDAHFVGEAAEQVIRSELEKQLDDAAYVPALPATNYNAFAPLVIDQQRRDEANIPADADLVFMDRCIVDNLGYLARLGIVEHVEDVSQHLRASKYTLAFFCDWLGKFEQTEIRRETAEEGLEIHRHLQTAYYNSGLPVVKLPAVSVEERLAIIRHSIEEIMSGNEIERKWLVDALPGDITQFPSSDIRQGYLAVTDHFEARLRQQAGKFTLTEKSAGGLVREEKELEISEGIFNRHWSDTEGRRIEKTRYLVPHGFQTIEVDVYKGRHEGLVVAELEFMCSALAKQFDPPQWLGEEVTENRAYKNKNLAVQGLPN